MKQKIRLVIAGAEYYVNSDEDASYLHGLAEEIDRRLADMEKDNPCLSTTMAAVLCALQLCDERSQRDREIADLKEKLRRAETDSASATIEANEAVREIRRLTDEILRLREKDC